MNLRSRLVLVTLSVVTVMGAVGLITIQINRGIHDDVRALRPDSKSELNPLALLGDALEIEGHWEPGRGFVALELESLPASRPPKLRGPIGALDHAAGTLELHGQTIVLDEETEFPGQERAPALATLLAGARVEISCRVEDDGTWTARKIETEAVKRSDKLKGVISAAEVLPDGTSLLSIQGLPIVVERGVPLRSKQGPLYSMENASRMALSIHECLAAAHGLLKERYLAQDAQVSQVAGRTRQQQAAFEELEERALDSLQIFLESLVLGRTSWQQPATPPAEGEVSAARVQPAAQLLDPLDAQAHQFEGQLTQFLALCELDLNAARALLQDEIEPRLRNEVLPLINAYHLDTEEALADELARIAAHADNAARLTSATTLLGLVAALGLGLVVSRSISRPIAALERAAQAIGTGQLDTRVVLHSNDELGALARTFNRMAEQLAGSTVSVANLNGILDSMAGALLILDTRFQITNVNPAASALLGYSEAQLLGQPFAHICPTCMQAGGPGSPAPGQHASVERQLFRKDGSSVAVSFSSASLSDEQGVVRGYVCVAQDLSGHKRLEERLRRSLAEKELLLRDVHHRVKNNLQVISSLLAIHARSIQDPQALESFQECQDRIQSIVFVHDQLYRARDMQEIHLKAYIELLASHVAQSYASPGLHIQLEVEIEDLSLDIDRGQLCGLIVNELLTNAYKHAFPEGRTGTIWLVCKAGPEGTLILEVCDDGTGSSQGHSPSSSASIGLVLVTTLVAQLRGNLQISKAPGSHYRIEFPTQSPVESA